MDKWTESNLEALKNTIGNVDLTDSEKGTLEWLSGFEKETVKNICSMIQKARKAKPIQQKPEKKEVWIVTAYFTEDSGYPDSEEFTADSYTEAEKVKRQILDEYDPDCIESVTISDDPEIRDFL